MLVEVSDGASSFRNVRAALLGLAYHLAHDKKARALLVLTNTRITQPRLERELALARQVFTPDVMKRLGATIETDGLFRGLPVDLLPGFPAKLAHLVREETARRKAGAMRGRLSEYSVFKILLHEWLLDRGPMTSDRIRKISGASYPTVASALKRYEHVLVRHSDRRVELSRFPMEEWAALVAVSDRARSTVRFTDRSGQPRSPESLYRRLGNHNLPDVAVGGVIAARHYLPSLDLAGTPRLDLTVNAIRGADLAFVEDLDPALRRTDRKDDPSTLVVHQINRNEALFVVGRDRVRYADPVECLLDLHEARLEQQAHELLDFFTSRKSAMTPTGRPSRS
ncbi:MAG: hypothetical protein IPP91_15620 [Betaproteobacteria bacterium]|nr:hypothetical protein [Betaproteobacteria bacterium]